MVQDFRFTHNSAVSNYIPNFRRIGKIRRFCGRRATPRHAAPRGRRRKTFLRDDIQHNCISLVAHQISNSSMIKPFLLYLFPSKSQKSVQEFLRKWHKTTFESPQCCDQKLICAALRAARDVRGTWNRDKAETSHLSAKIQVYLSRYPVL